MGRLTILNKATKEAKMVALLWRTQHINRADCGMVMINVMLAAISLSDCSGGRIICTSILPHLVADSAL